MSYRNYVRISFVWFIHLVFYSFQKNGYSVVFNNCGSSFVYFWVIGKVDTQKGVYSWVDKWQFGDPRQQQQHSVIETERLRRVSFWGWFIFIRIRWGGWWGFLQENYYSPSWCVASSRFVVATYRTRFVGCALVESLYRLCVHLPCTVVEIKRQMATERDLDWIPNILLNGDSLVFGSCWNWKVRNWGECSLNDQWQYYCVFQRAPLKFTYFHSFI